MRFNAPIFRRAEWRWLIEPVAPLFLRFDSLFSSAPAVRFTRRVLIHGWKDHSGVTVLLCAASRDGNDTPRCTRSCLKKL